MGSPRKALAAGTTGCFVCDSWTDEMIPLADHGVRVCRPCMNRIGHAILRMSPHVVGRLWPRSGEAHESPPAKERATDLNVERDLAAFRAGVEHAIPAGDALSHFDLAVAYGEMGLMADAIREAATVLVAQPSHPRGIADYALTWIFAEGRAHRDALRMIARMLREA